MMVRPTRIVLSVVTFRSDIGMLRDCLRSVLAALDHLGASYPVSCCIVVVANDEAEKEVESVACCVRTAVAGSRWAENVSVLSGHGNIGYGAAHNLGFRHVRSDVHVFLNPDVILDERALTEALRYLWVDPRTVMVAPQGFDGAGRYLHLAKRMPSVVVLLLRAFSVSAAPTGVGRPVFRYIYGESLPSDRPQRIELASGCFLFCRSSAFEEVGGFDERYFLFFEDYDLSRRISVLGDIVEVPSVRIRHFGGNTSRRGLRRIALFVRSAVRFFASYGWRLI